jgi:hypothetical protein
MVGCERHSLTWLREGLAFMLVHEYQLEITEIVLLLRTFPFHPN